MKNFFVLATSTKSGDESSRIAKSDSHGGKVIAEIFRAVWFNNIVKIFFGTGFTMNIAIIDEEKVDLETAEAYLKKYIRDNWAQYAADINVDIFLRPENFKRFFRRGLYQIVLVGFCTEDIAEFLHARDENVNVFHLIRNDDCEEDFL